MNAVRTFLHAFVIAAMAITSLVVPTHAFPLSAPSAPAGNAVVPVQGDCYAIGMQQAAQVGGQLARATPEVRGGRQVCVIVILMPARDGQRPRRQEIVVPMG